MRRLPTLIAAAAFAIMASACTASGLDTSGPQTVDVDGVTFSYECRGEGSPPISKHLCTPVRGLATPYRMPVVGGAGSAEDSGFLVTDRWCLDIE